MTDQEINIAIAEECGKSIYAVCSICETMHTYYMSHEDKEAYCCGPCDKITKHYLTTPNYCNDLNAMHEAENILRIDEGVYQSGGVCHYMKSLAEVCDQQVGWAQIHANARQRAEAFLRTKGKWI